jgi:hypothetical protein
LSHLVYLGVATTSQDNSPGDLFATTAFYNIQPQLIVDCFNPQVRISRADGKIWLDWCDHYDIESAPTLQGPWTVHRHWFSPTEILPADTTLFFRIWH